MTGRKMALTGEVKPRLWPSLGVTTGPVSIANADWAESDKPLFRAESLSIDVNLGALMGGEVRILGLSADQPEFNLGFSCFAEVYARRRRDAKSGGPHWHQMAATGARPWAFLNQRCAV